MMSYIDNMDNIKVTRSMRSENCPEWEIQSGEDKHLSSFVVAHIEADDCGEFFGFISCMEGDEEHGATEVFAGADTCDDLPQAYYTNGDALMIDLCIATLHMLTDAYADARISSLDFQEWHSCLLALIARARRNRR